MKTADSAWNEVRPAMEALPGTSTTGAARDDHSDSIPAGWDYTGI